MLTHNRFNTYKVLIFTDLKKAQIYKIPYRNGHHQEIEIVKKFDYQHLFKPFGLDEKTHARRETKENFLFKIEDKKYIFVGETIPTFKTTDDIDEYFSECKRNDVKYPFALSKEILSNMLYQKYITVEEFENTKMADEYQYLYKKDSELKCDNIIENDGRIQYGNVFVNCKIIDSSTFSL